jgi:hypothetical protein
MPQADTMLRSRRHVFRLTADALGGMAKLV